MALKMRIQVDSRGHLFKLIEGQKAVPIMRWVEDSQGNRRPGNTQETDAEGTPKWTLPVVLQTMNYGRVVPELVDLVYFSADGSLPDGGNLFV